MNSVSSASRSAPLHDYAALLSELGSHLAGRRESGASTGLLIVHIINLKRINTTVGYRMGQKASLDFALQVNQMLRETDWMRPLAHDRFAVVLDRLKNPGHMVLAANRIARFTRSIGVNDDSGLQLEVRIGAAMFPEQAQNAESLLRNAELAVETASLRGSIFSIYEAAETQHLTEDWDIEAQIGEGLENNEFELLYQPKIDARTLLPCGAEGLMRWHSTALGAVSTERFIQIIETTDHIDALTSFALHCAARNLSEWPTCDAELNVAVNLSPSVIEHGSCVSRFKQVAAIWGVELTRFTAEVTENGIISTAGAGLDALQELRDAGIRVSIDDFGTGNSSLAYFKSIPADEVKIDKSFVFGMLDNDANHRLVKTIIDLAHGFGLDVVAEGVENAEVVKALQQLGCDVLQGYHFARPMKANDFVDYLTGSADASRRLRAL